MATKTPDVTHIPFKIKAPHRIAVKNVFTGSCAELYGGHKLHCTASNLQTEINHAGHTSRRLRLSLRWTSLDSWSKSSLIAGRDQRLLLLKLDLPHLPPPPQMFLILQRENQQSLLLLLLPNKFLMIFPK
ncbi:hypothetical protein NQZ68_026831 [Dissostichus eleginoides]|nr:hypothetical protein NQZ68_026831 [Dissostichus eleginoides]